MRILRAVLLLVQHCCTDLSFVQEEPPQEHLVKGDKPLMFGFRVQGLGEGQEASDHG